MAAVTFTGLDEPVAVTTRAQKASMVVLSDWQEAMRVLEQEPGFISLDLETSGLKWWADRIAVVAMYGPATNTAAVLHFRGAKLPPELVAWLSSPRRHFITHNGTCFDWLFLSSYGMDYRGPKTFDTLIGEQVILTTNRKDVKVNLKDTLSRRLGVTIPKNVDHATWMQPELDEDQRRYLADDIFYLPRLKQNQEVRAAEQDAKWQRDGEPGVRDALVFEQNLAPIVTQMIQHGLPLDLEALRAYTTKAMEDVPHHQAWLLETLGIPKLGYAPVVRDAFNRVYDLDIPDTTKETMAYLQESEGPVAEAASRMVKYRQGSKRDAMYDQDFIDSFVNQWAQPSRLYGSFVQAGTDTGRFSSRNPNLQQIPRDMRYVIRDPGGEEAVVAADYSAIEVRVAADLFQDAALLSALADTDIHRAVAADLFQVPYEEVTKDQRRLAKAGSFNLTFGGGAKTMYLRARADGSKASLAEVTAAADRFLMRYQGIAGARNMAFMKAGQGRPVPLTFPTGLRKVLVGPDLKGTTILNNSVQSVAAAGLKQALLLLDQRGFGKYLAAVVHDEIVTTCPKAEAQELGRELVKAMVDAMAIVTSAPVAVDLKDGPGWE